MWVAEKLDWKGLMSTMFICTYCMFDSVTDDIRRDADDVRQWVLKKIFGLNGEK
jgi:hypothetical protein